ncbi:MAG: hypothetical protein Tsb0014_08890 [Pleurocapsa sp.]
MKDSRKRFKTLISLATLPVAIATVTISSIVNALPASAENNSTVSNLRQLIQKIAQNNDEPPEVIIDNDSGSYPPPPPTTSQNNDGETRFMCENVNGEYTVMYYPESQPDRGYPWAIPSQMGGNWSPQRRCNEITRRFESYRQDGLLEMSTGVVNNLDVICVTTQVDPTDCRLLLTIPPGQDPQLTRNLIFENLIIADDGQQTDGVYTFGDREKPKDVLNEVGEIIGVAGGDSNDDGKSTDDIDLRPFLDPADGGTGTQLTKKNSVTPRNSNTNSNPPSDERKPAIFQ